MSFLLQSDVAGVGKSGDVSLNIAKTSGTKCHLETADDLFGRIENVEAVVVGRIDNGARKTSTE